MLLSVCLLSQSAKATYAGSETSTYVFVPDQSTVVQTGGIAYVHWTYSIKGQFELTVDPNAGTASFAHVDANATDDSPFKRTLDLNHVFNMTSLLGTVVDDTTIKFTGKAADGSDVLITVTLQDNLAHLIGQTTSPPNSADFFIFNLDAVVQRKYTGGSDTPQNPYQIATANDLVDLGNNPADWNDCFVLTADIELSRYYTGGGAGFRIGTETTPFRGTFDGSGHIISGFTYITTEPNLVGLFGYVDDGQIYNLRLANVVLKGVGNIGGLVVCQNCTCG
jgi:hypothetical protein